MTSRRIKLAYPEPNYRYRLMLLAIGTVYPGVSVEEVRSEILRRRDIEGIVIARDFRKLCMLIWRRNGYGS